MAVNADEDNLYLKTIFMFNFNPERKKMSMELFHLMSVTGILCVGPVICILFEKKKDLDICLKWFVF